MKLYHPDSAQSLCKNHSSEILTSEIRRERLNVISAAYDALRGIKPIQPRWGPYSRTSSARGTAGGGAGTGSSGEDERRRWTGRRNQWGGFEYEPQVQPHPDGLTEPFFLSKNGVLITLVVIVVSNALLTLVLFSFFLLFFWWLASFPLSRLPMPDDLDWFFSLRWRVLYLYVDIDSIVSSINLHIPDYRRGTTSWWSSTQSWRGSSFG